MPFTGQRFAQLGRSSITPASAHPFNALGPLVGRDGDLTDLRTQMLDPTVRLVTLTGPSGVGKSRLAAALFNDIYTDFADGGHYLDLASVTASENLPDCLAALLTDEAGPGSSSLSRLADQLSDAEHLLIFDHCEHVVASVVSTVSSLLITCPRLRVMVSSHEPSHVYGASVYRLPPLAVPGAAPPEDPDALQGVGSVALFLLRTAAMRPGFRLTSQNREVVTELCRRLDGLPLAIELAAARMKLLTPGALLTELDRGLEILQAGREDTLSRHVSMEAAIKDNCARLTPRARSLFTMLAVFTTEFELKTVQAVIRPQEGSVQEVLEDLVDKNLLMAREMASGELGFSMLKTTRAYALGTLRRGGGLERAKRSHATYFLATAQAAEPELANRNQYWRFNQLSHWREEFNAVFAFFLERGEGGKVAALAAALRPFWLISGRLREGMNWLVEAQATGGLNEELEAKTLDATGELAAFLGDPSAEERLTRARDTYGGLRDRRGAAACLHHLGKLAYFQGDLERAQHFLNEAVSMRRTAGDLGGYAMASCDLAQLLRDIEEFGAARQSAETALRSFQKIENLRGVAITCYVLASITATEGCADDHAEELCREGTRILDELGERPWLTTGLELSAVLLSLRGRTREGWRVIAILLAAARAARDRIGITLPSHLRSPIDDVTERARVRLGPDMFNNAWAEGRGHSLQTAVVHALAPVTWEPAAIQRLDNDLDRPLTPREHEVAELVAYGLTNRQIARRLGIAEWTAVNHLRKVMRKLSCSSRVQVANWVANRREVKGAEATAVSRPLY